MVCRAAALWALVAAGRPRVLAAQSDLACERGAPEVRRIVVVGAVEPSEGEVRGALASEPTSPWRRILRLPIGDRHCLDSLELSRDRERLRALHLQHGLFLASTSFSVVTRSATSVDVVFTITEGTRTVLDSVRVRGLDTIPAARELAVQLFQEMSGTPFNEPELLAAVDSVQGWMLEAGYLRAGKPSLRLVRDSVRHRAWLDVGYQPGRRLVIGAVDVAIRPSEGATTPRIRESVVRRRLLLTPGDAPSPALILRTQRGLFELDAYQLVRIDTSAMGSASDRDSLRVTLNLVESSTRSLRVGGGWATLDCFRTQGRWVDRSVLGLARRLEVDLRLSKIGRGAPLGQFSGACAPVVRDDPFSDRLNYFVGATTYFTDLFGRKVTPQLTLYSESRSEVFAYRRDTPIGLRVQVSAPFPPFVSGTAALSYEYGRTDADEAVMCLIFGACTADEVVRRQQGGSIATLSLGGVYDITGGLLDPLKGARFRVENRLGVASLAGASGLFDRVMLEGTLFRPLSPNVTLAARVQFGVISRLSSNAGSASAIPLQERFFLGGQNSVRGFGQNQMGDVLYVMTGADTVAVDPLTQLATLVSRPGQIVRRVSPVGGEASFVSSLELRVRAPRILGPISIAGFVDAGQLKRTSEELFRFDDVRFTPGVGVRLATAFGLFRVDVGYNPYGQAAGPAFLPVTAAVTGGGRLLCVSPGTTDRLNLTTGAVVSGSGDCPAAFAPPAATTTASRLVFHFGIGQAF